MVDVIMPVHRRIAAVDWDVDRVWYHDISTTCCARGRQGDPGVYVQNGINRGIYTTADVEKWEATFNDGRWVATIGGVADMFTAFYNKMTKPDGSRILTKEQTIELKQRLLKGMTLGEVKKIAKSVPYTQGLDSTTTTFRERGMHQAAFSDGFAPFVTYHMIVLHMDVGYATPALISNEGTAGFRGGQWNFMNLPDSVTMLGEVDKNFNKSDAAKSYFFSRGPPLSQIAAIDDSESAIPFLKEVQQTGGLAVGFNVLPGQVAKFREAGIPILKGNSLLPFAELVLDPSEANLGRYCE